MDRPNVKQWVVLWSGAVWTVGSLLIAGDYFVRALIAGFVVTALLFWQLGGRRILSPQALRATPPDPPPSSNPNPEAQPPLAEVVHAADAPSTVPVVPVAEPSGVGGWLVLPLIGILLTPVLTVYVLSLYGEIWTDRWYFTLVMAGGIFSGWSLIVALALLNRWPGAPKLAQAQLTGSMIFWTGLLILARISASVDITESIPTMVGSLLGTLLWVSYFSQSSRVRATYGPMSPGPIRLARARMMGLVAGILVCFITIGIADSRRQVWAEYVSEDGHYDVKAPGTAKISTLENGVIEVNFGNDVRGYSVSTAAITPENSDVQTYFQTVRTTVVTNLKGSLIKNSPLDLDGHPGIEFVATFPGKAITGDLRGRIYRTDSEGFLLLVSGPQGGRTASDAGKFFRSFRIKP